MAYAVKTDMVSRFGEQVLILLTDLDIPKTGQIVEARLQKALDDAAGKIDGYLASRYTLPLASVPVELTRNACEIAQYFLYKNPPEEVDKRFRDAVAWLKDVASGKVSLGPDSLASTPAPSGGPQYSGDDRVFSKTTLSDY